jgi:uncharacterized membrane protein YkoI
MFSKIGKVGASLAALAAVAVGSAAIAGAATSGSQSGSSQGAAAQGYGQPPRGGPGGPHDGMRGGPGDHKPETALTGDTAAKVKAAALDKLPGGTIIRVETDSDHGSPYEAHVKKSDGSEAEVLVNKQFKVTAVNER